MGSSPDGERINQVALGTVLFANPEFGAALGEIEVTYRR